MSTRSDLDGLTLLKGQVSLDATAGVDVTGAHIIEFGTVGTVTVTYKDATTDSYVVSNVGTRVSNAFSSDNPIVTITYAGIISWS